MKARIAAVACAATLAVATGGTVASAATAPFTDTNQNGLITLCDASGHRITSGDIRQVPFIYSAVSTSAAPAGYGNGLATLYAYQPIEYVDPSDWTGDQLSGSSYFSNAANPGTVLTPGDGPLVSFTSGYPLHWNGLLQLRLYYTARNMPQYSGDYPAAVLQVTGDKWTAVQEGDASCTATKFESTESLYLKGAQYKPTSTVGYAAVGGKAVPKGSGGPTSTSSPGGATTSGGPGGAAGTGRNVADSSSSVRGGVSPWLWLLLLIPLVGGAGVLARRRRVLPGDEQ